jgi:DNA replication protein DnaC
VASAWAVAERAPQCLLEEQLVPTRKDRLQQIIDLRTANRLPTIVTTNLVAADFDAAGAERIASRFNQVLYPIKCTWSDFRKRSALKNLKPEEVF